MDELAPKSKNSAIRGCLTKKNTSNIRKPRQGRTAGTDVHFQHGAATRRFHLQQAVTRSRLIPVGSGPKSNTQSPPGEATTWTSETVSQGSQTSILLPRRHPRRPAIQPWRAGWPGFESGRQRHHPGHRPRPGQTGGCEPGDQDVTKANRMGRVKLPVLQARVGHARGGRTAGLWVGWLGMWVVSPWFPLSPVLAGDYLGGGGKTGSRNKAQGFRENQGQRPQLSGLEWPEPWN